MIVTLCGSTRFQSAHELAMMHLTLMGHIVIPCGLYGHNDSPDGAMHLTRDGNSEWEVKRDLDELHMQKIDASEAIFVVNVGCYIGRSTQAEIDYAQRTGKGVWYMFPHLSTRVGHK